MSKQQTASRKMKVVTFTCNAPDAQSVLLAGSFDDWNPLANPMERGDEGEWTIKKKLRPGHYEFKFIVDGQWVCKPGCRDFGHICAECVPNELGTMNRAIEVK